MKKRQAVLVDTRHFRFVHGRAPRGQGRWMFEVDAQYGEGRFLFTGMFSAAKAEAALWAKNSGVRVLHVCS